MKRWQLTTKAILVLVALMFNSAPSNAVPENAYQNVFIEHLEIGPATYLDSMFTVKQRRKSIEGSRSYIIATNCSLFG